MTGAARAILLLTTLTTLGWSTSISAADATAPPILPMDEVRPGMTGIGRTVFEGQRVDGFDVRILAVLRNTRPRQSMIVARLEGGPLERSGVLAGMSGSPVFVDGRLIGAIAFSFPFAKEPIAGITPIAEMLEAGSGATRAISTRLRPSWPSDSRTSSSDGMRDVMRAILDSAPTGMLGPAGAPAAEGEAWRSGAAVPIAVPLVFSGFEESALDHVRPFFSARGFAPIAGPSAAGTSAPGPALEPGAAVGLSLVEGDLDVSATGTVTHIEGDRVWAFGHPLYNLGPTAFPMKKAIVHSVLPSLYQSSKIASVTETVGVFEQDRATAMSGRMGAGPRMVPLDLHLVSPRGGDRHLSFRIVDDPLLGPVLVYLSLLSTLQSHERANGAATLRVEGRLRVRGHAPVRLADTFASNQPASDAAALIAAPLALIVANDFEETAIEELEVRVEADEKERRATLDRIWLERTGPLRRGARLSLRALLRTYRGEVRAVDAPLDLPATVAPGRYVLAVLDAASLTRFEQREARDLLRAPRSLDQLLHLMADMRRNSSLYVRLLRAEDGVAVSGGSMPGLPPSILTVLQTAPTSGDVVPLHATSVLDREVPLDLVVRGARTLPVVVEP